MRRPHANPLIADAVDQLKRETDDDEPRAMTREELLAWQREQHEAKRCAAHAAVDATFDDVWRKCEAQVEALWRELDGQRPS